MNASSILILYLVLFGIRLLWEIFLNILNQRYVNDKIHDPPELIKSIADKDTILRSADYTLTKARFSLVSSLFSSAFILFIIISGFLGVFETFVSGLGFSRFTGGIVFYFSISLIFSIFSIPFSLYSQFVIEEKFGFNRMTLSLFFNIISFKH